MDSNTHFISLLTNLIPLIFFVKNKSLETPIQQFLFFSEEIQN